MPVGTFRASSLNRSASTLGFSDWEKGQLIGTGDIVDDAKKAFQRNEWFGAFARIHCMIEFWMQEIVEYDSKKDQTGEQVEYLNKNYFYGYWRLVEELRKRSIITDEEAARIVDFGRVRNQIFHRLVKHSYSTARNNPVGRDEVAKTFAEGLALETLVKERLRRISSDTHC